MAKLNDYSSTVRKPGVNISTAKKANSSRIKAETSDQKPLGKNNYIGMIASGVMIVVGFLLMLGGSTTTDHFEESIFSTRRLIIGPTICFLGFIAMGIAIILRPDTKLKAKGMKVSETTTTKDIETETTIQ